MNTAKPCRSSSVSPPLTSIKSLEFRAFRADRVIRRRTACPLMHEGQEELMRRSRIYTNSQLKCLTEHIRFFVLTKPSAVRRYLRYVERNEAQSERKRWCADWAILTRIRIPPFLPNSRPKPKIKGFHSLFSCFLLLKCADVRRKRKEPFSLCGRPSVWYSSRSISNQFKEVVSFGIHLPKETTSLFMQFGEALRIRPFPWAYGDTLGLPP